MSKQRQKGLDISVLYQIKDRHWNSSVARDSYQWLSSQSSEENVLTIKYTINVCLLNRITKTHCQMR